MSNEEIDFAAPLWISHNDPPIYIRHGDLWFNQKDKITYIADFEANVWRNEDKIHPFSKKTIKLNEEHERTAKKNIYHGRQCQVSLLSKQRHSQSFARTQRNDRVAQIG